MLLVDSTMSELIADASEHIAFSWQHVNRVNDYSGFLVDFFRRCHPPEHDKMHVWPIYRVALIDWHYSLAVQVAVFPLQRFALAILESPGVTYVSSTIGTTSGLTKDCKCNLQHVIVRQIPGASK